MAIAYVKDTGLQSGANVDSDAGDFGTLPAAGNAIFVATSCWMTTGADIADGGVTDNQSNTYTRAVQSALQGNSRASIHYDSDIGTPSGTHTVTVNPVGTGNYLNWIAAEFSGIADASALDVTTSASGADAAPVSGTTATTAQADELVIVSLNTNLNLADDGIDVPATTGYTNLAVYQASNTIIGFAADYKIVAATGAQSAAWGTLNASLNWSGCIATFKAAAVAAAANRLTLLGVG